MTDDDLFEEIEKRGENPSFCFTLNRDSIHDEDGSQAKPFATVANAKVKEMIQELPDQKMTSDLMIITQLCCESLESHYFILLLYSLITPQC